MDRLLPLPDIVIPLLQGLVVTARNIESVFELGSIPVRAGHDPAVVVVVDVFPHSGWGTWSAGFWWPDEAEPRWPDDDRRLDRDRVALPVHPDADGPDLNVRVMARLRPLGPASVAIAMFNAFARFPV